jgi:hypothetical protein
VLGPKHPLLLRHFSMNPVRLDVSLHSFRENIAQCLSAGNLLLQFCKSLICLASLAPKTHVYIVFRLQSVPRSSCPQNCEPFTDISSGHKQQKIDSPNESSRNKIVAGKGFIALTSLS